MKKYLLVSLLFTYSISSTIFADSRTPEPIAEPLGTTATEVLASALFAETEKQVFSQYLGNPDGHYSRDRDWDDDDDHANKDKHGKKHKQKSLPPGLQKKLERGGELPPGWQKKVERGEVLDEDIYINHARSLPEDILRRLPSTPEGTTLRQIDDRIVRVQDATRTILDVFYLMKPQ
tara:strand:+ start:2271 stop:2801 length:531 start_codon:yes stop_codon:yes gene_type:complete